MRIPFFIAIPAGLLTIVLVWWIGTNEMDFLTPPSEARLEKIREEALASLPVSRMEDDAISIKVPLPEQDATAPDPIQFTEPIDLGELNAPPSLDAYSDRAPEGSDQLLALANALEIEGKFQRALLAYERALDLSQSNPEQIQTAVGAIYRLKPTLPLWNSEPSEAAPIVIHIGTGERFAEVLPDILQEISADLRNASSGLINFSEKLHIGKSIQTNDGPTPVAVWITGPEKGSPSTDVLSFTTNDPEKLRNDLLKTIFNLIRGHLSKSSSYTPAPEAFDDPLQALDSHITRLLWKEFATLLNPAEEEN